MCSVAVGSVGSGGDVGGDTASEEDQGRTSEEEDTCDSNYDKQVSYQCQLNFSRLKMKQFIQHVKKCFYNIQ